MADRKEENKQFSEELSNFESALSGLAKAKDVLTEFYDKLAEKNKELEEKAALLRVEAQETGYQIHVLKDSPGGKLMQVKGMVSVSKLKKICTANPKCVAFNSKGWLLSSLAPEGEWSRRTAAGRAELLAKGASGRMQRPAELVPIWNGPVWSVKAHYGP